MTTTTQLGSPVAPKIAGLEADLEEAHRELAHAKARIPELSEAYDRISVEHDRDPGEIPFTRVAAAQHTLEEAERRVKVKQLKVEAIERDIEAAKAREPEIIREANRLINLVNSHNHVADQIPVRDVVDRIEDVNAIRDQAKQTFSHLRDALGYDATHVLERIEPPPTLPLDVVLLMAPQELRDAMTVTLQRETLRGRMGQIINSSDPNRFTLASQLQARLTDAERIVGSLAAGGSPVDTPAPQMVRDAVMGESRTLTPPGGIPGGH